MERQPQRRDAVAVTKRDQTLFKEDAPQKIQEEEASYRMPVLRCFGVPFGSKRRGGEGVCRLGRAGGGIYASYCQIRGRQLVPD